MAKRSLSTPNQRVACVAIGTAAVFAVWPFLTSLAWRVDGTSQKVYAQESEPILTRLAIGGVLLQLDMGKDEVMDDLRGNGLTVKEIELSDDDGWTIYKEVNGEYETVGDIFFESERLVEIRRQWPTESNTWAKSLSQALSQGISKGKWVPATAQAYDSAAPDGQLFSFKIRSGNWELTVLSIDDARNVIPLNGSIVESIER